MRICLTSDTHYGFTSGTTANLLSKMLKQMVNEKPDVILHAGDWGSTSQQHVEKCMKMFRKFFPDTNIIGVAGNHDYWVSDKEELEFKTVKSLEDNWFRLITENNICYQYSSNDSSVDILAYNSWYKTSTPPSNDGSWIPWLLHADSEPIVFTNAHQRKKDMHQYFISASREECASVCRRLKESKAKTKIVLTHFQATGAYRSNPGWDGMNGSEPEYENIVSAGANIICYGHTHRPVNELNNKGVRILNSGSDYDKPKYIMFEV